MTSVSQLREHSVLDFCFKFSAVYTSYGNTCLFFVGWVLSLSFLGICFCILNLISLVLLALHCVIISCNSHWDGYYWQFSELHFTSLSITRTLVPHFPLFSGSCPLASEQIFLESSPSDSLLLCISEFLWQKVFP